MGPVTSLPWSGLLGEGETCGVGGFRQGVGWTWPGIITEVGGGCWVSKEKKVHQENMVQQSRRERPGSGRTRGQVMVELELHGAEGGAGVLRRLRRRAFEGAVMSWARRGLGGVLISRRAMPSAAIFVGGRSGLQGFLSAGAEVGVAVVGFAAVFMRGQRGHGPSRFSTKLSIIFFQALDGLGTS